MRPATLPGNRVGVRPSAGCPRSGPARGKATEPSAHFVARFPVTLSLGSRRPAMRSDGEVVSQERNKQMDLDEDKEQVADLDRRWNIAYAEHRRRELAEVLADDFLASTADGRVVTKSHLMSVDEPATVTFSHFDIHLFGATAVTRGRIRVERPAGEAVEQRFFRVYSKRDGRWAAVAVQVLPVGR